MTIYQVKCGALCWKRQNHDLGFYSGQLMSSLIYYMIKMALLYNKQYWNYIVADCHYGCRIENKD